MKSHISWMEDIRARLSISSAANNNENSFCKPRIIRTIFIESIELSGEAGVIGGAPGAR